MAVVGRLCGICLIGGLCRIHFVFSVAVGTLLFACFVGGAVHAVCAVVHFVIHAVIHIAAGILSLICF